MTQTKSPPQTNPTLSPYYRLISGAGCGLMLGAMGLVFWQVTGAWLAAVVFGVVGVGLLGLGFRAKFSNDALNLGVIWAASLGAIWPLLQNRMLITHDLPVWHLFFLNQFDKQFRQGSLYPRWADDFNYGHGNPIFNFYPPAGRYLPEAFHLLGLNFADSFNIVLALAAIGSGLAMYLFARATFARAETQKLGALLAGLAYLYYPYRLSETYQRGDIAEILFSVLTPLILLAIFRMIVDGPSLSRGLGTSAAVGLALLTHHLQVAITAIFGGLWLIGILVVLYKYRIAHKSDSPDYIPSEDMSYLSLRELGRRLGALAGAGVFGLALGAIFWLPTIAEKDATLVHYFNQTVRRDFAFSNQNLSLFPPITPESYNTNWIGLNHILLALGIGLVWLWQPESRKQSLNRIQAIIFFVVLILVLFTQSTAFYDLFVAINKAIPIQFPSRFMLFAGIASTWLIGLLPQLLKGRAKLVGVGLAVVWCVACGLINLRTFDFGPDYDGTISAEVLASDIGRALPSHLPSSLQATLDEIGILKIEDPAESDHKMAELFATEQGGSPDATSFQIKAVKPRFDVDITVSGATIVAVPPFYFAGWKVYLLNNGTEKELPTFATGRAALLGVKLPAAGSYQLVARFEDTPIRSYSTWISLLGWAIWLGLLSVAGLPRKK